MKQYYQECKNKLNDKLQQVRAEFAEDSVKLAQRYQKAVQELQTEYNEILKKEAESKKTKK